MSTHTADTTVGWDSAMWGKIRGRAAEVHEILQATEGCEQFQAADIDALDGTDSRVTLRILREAGAVRRVGREYANDDDGNTIQRYNYRFRRGPRDDLEAYVGRLDRFPCGHRTHVYNPRDTDDDTLACKECGREYPKEYVREVL